MEPTLTKLRLQFFQFLFGKTEGFVCIATGDKTEARKTFKQHFFHWPSQAEFMNETIEKHQASKNIWFCVNLLDKQERKRETAMPLDIVWSDLDTCDPKIVHPHPTVVINSSPGRYQGIWKLDQVVIPEIAEDYSKRIAYKYNQNGADPSGWDLTQLLRVPFTSNFKYAETPQVSVDPEVGQPIPLEVFERIDPAPATTKVDESSPDTPDITALPPSDKVIYKYQAYLDQSFYDLHTIEPDESEDWSVRMWKLINLCFEAGMDAEEVFAVTIKAKCNKYERDKRPLRYLWKEIQKAQLVQNKIADVQGNWEPLLMPELVSQDSCTFDTFIDQYREWAVKATDAVPIYHDLGAAMLLSCVLAGHIKIETSYGNWAPNLWAMILGESTLTRKSTAMMMIMSILNEVDPDAILATDGSAEGILSSLAQRSGRVSLYYRDEVAGLFDAVNRKDYLAGIPETFTLLYDGSPVKRTLRKEEIYVQNPVFLFFGGGIKDKTYSVLNDSYILSGFLPRFLVVNGENDLSRLRRTGPANSVGILERDRLVDKLRDLQDSYRIEAKAKIGNQVVDLSDSSKRPTKSAKLTQEAWDFYGDIETKMVEAAAASYYSSLALPTFERLSRSLLKLSVLLAASSQEPEGDSFPVGKQDVINAAYYIQTWGKHSVDLIMNAGKPQILRLVEKIRLQIDKRPGVMKTELLRTNHMSSRDMAEVIATLRDRGEITIKKMGRSEKYWTIH